jgi:hypothetical protein
VFLLVAIIGFLSWYLWKKYGKSLCQRGSNAEQTEGNEMTDLTEQPQEDLTEIVAA